jgi:hypothetical protein
MKCPVRKQQRFHSSIPPKTVEHFKRQRKVLKAETLKAAKKNN